ncbi:MULTISPECIES: hypothetical protein [unclassified Bradyrhizobium]|uniref:hypothetical protein n=1 Tax=unclassified Bradyrhizobium TaxID=2631580 RepID=UPI001FF8C549|nr:MULTISPECIES: hypothetical protein [unclassified Bradyrhizobium]MCK1310805.1 hypothetical protein [Bradyrhizobium sp. 45]MCK1469944.1 hypothetical protein [Bradyrhizobium sp. CW10]MCK1612044.1 hypothetical protein [Bradyrhizobium sp. 163]MCK1767418.1 hypothetical protein [Bradyrhizobium sp. 136]
MADYVFNSATLNPPYPTRAEAEPHLALLLEGLAALDAESDVLPTFRLPNDPWYVVLARHADGSEVTLGEMAHAFYGTTYHDYAAFFDQLSRAIPSDVGLEDSVVDELLQVAPEEAAVGYEQTFPSVQAAAFDAVLCAVTNSILVGLFRSGLWDFDSMGFLSKEIAYCFDHVAIPSHAVAIADRRTRLVRSDLTSRNFWQRRSEAFPHLAFGLDVESQIGKFSATLLPLLFRRLSELDNLAGAWRESATAHPPAMLPPITRESEATMARYANARKFRGEDGVSRTFEDHIWVDRTHRVHIFLHDKEKKIEVGYVGRHLPISSQPT